MSTSKIAFIAAFAGMSIAAPAFAQSQDLYGCVLPYHYEGETRVWGSWYARDPALIDQRIPLSSSRPNYRQGATGVGPQ